MAETSKAGSFLFPRDHAFLFHVLTLMIYSCLGATMMSHNDEHPFQDFRIHHKSFFAQKYHWKALENVGQALMHKPLPKHKFRASLNYTSTTNLTAAVRPLSALLRPLSALMWPKVSAVLQPLSALLRPLSALLRSRFALLRPQKLISESDGVQTIFRSGMPHTCMGNSPWLTCKLLV